MEATIKTLATKDDLEKFKYEMVKGSSEKKADTIKWMFVFWIGQAIVTLAILLFLKK